MYGAELASIKAEQPHVTLSSALAQAVSVGGGLQRRCPDGVGGDNLPPGKDLCAGTTRLARWCLNLPSVFAMAIVWSPDWVLHDLTSLLDLVTQEIDLTKVGKCISHFPHDNLLACAYARHPAAARPHVRSCSLMFPRVPSCRVPSCSLDASVCRSGWVPGRVP